MKHQKLDTIDPKLLQSYEIIQSIGQGGYGKVWKAKKKQNSAIMAIKKIYDAFRNTTDAQRAYRQIKYLQKIQHSNIVSLHSFHLSHTSQDIYMVFQHMESDLSSAIRSGVLKQIHKHFIFYQVVNGVHFLHSAQLIHRDLKPANILINQNCEVKICDFGLVRSLLPSQGKKSLQLTENIATRWYRAPEVLLCTNDYGKPVDIWGLGCILAQIFIGKPIFQGSSAISQLQKIFEVTGKPSRQDLYFIKSEASKSIVESMHIQSRKSLFDIIQRKDKHFLDLLEKIFVIDPAKRITIEEIMQHPFVNVFQGKVDEKKAVDAIKVLYDDKNLGPERYKTLLISQLEQKGLHSGSQPSTFHESIFRQSLKSNHSEHILKNWPLQSKNRFKNQGEVRKCFGHEQSSYLLKKKGQVNKTMVDKKFTRLKTEEDPDKYQMPFLYGKNMQSFKAEPFKFQNSHKIIDKMQKEKQQYIIKYRKSRSPPNNPEKMQKNILSKEKIQKRFQDNFLTRTFSRNSCKNLVMQRQNQQRMQRITSFKSHSPSPTNILEVNSNKNLKKQKIVPNFIKNKTFFRSKSPRDDSLKKNTSSQYQTETKKKLNIFPPTVKKNEALFQEKKMIPKQPTAFINIKPPKTYQQKSKKQVILS